MAGLPRPHSAGISHLHEAKAQRIISANIRLQSCRAAIENANADEKAQLMKEIKELEKVPDQNVFMAQSADYLRRNDELKAIIENPNQTKEKRQQAQIDLDKLANDFRDEFLQDDIEKQKKPKQKKGVSSRSRCVRRPKGRFSYYIPTTEQVRADLVDIANNEDAGIRYEQDKEERDGKLDVGEIGYDREHDQPDCRESKKFAYKRLGHFLECLKQVQGKSTERLPEISEGVKQEFIKSGLPFDKITPERVRKKLKLLGLTNKYDQSTSICCELNPSFVPIVIPADRELVLKRKFQKLEPVFDEIKGLVRRTRKNFMSYHFVAYKLCELLGYTEYLSSFTPLKAQNLRIEQDSFWKLCCAKLGWEFLRSTGNLAESSWIRKRKREDSDTQSTKKSKSVESETISLEISSVKRRKRKREDSENQTHKKAKK